MVSLAKETFFAYPSFAQLLRLTLSKIKVGYCHLVDSRVDSDVRRSTSVFLGCPTARRSLPGIGCSDSRLFIQLSFKR